MTDWTQSNYDAEVSAIKTASVSFIQKVCRLTKFRDQDAYRRQHQLMRLLVCIHCLEDYQVADEYLDDNQIQITLEQAKKVLSSCP
jgi:hypothetical protein